MTGRRSEVAPRDRTVELVPDRRGTWVPAQAQQRPAVRAVQAWLRQCLIPADPATYLSPAETCRIRTRLHWVVPLKRVVQVGVSMPLWILLTLATTFLLPGVWWLQMGMGLATVAHQLWLAYLIVAWRVDEVIVTDRRVLRVHGVFSTSVDAVKLAHITDTSYHQSLLGHVFGYGRIRIESAGQTQSLELLDYVPNPAEVYRSLA